MSRFREGRLRFFNHDPSGPHSVRAIIDHAVVTASQIIRGTVTVTGNVGQLFQLVATAFDASGNAIPGVTVAWTDDGTGIASVSASGLVTMLRTGTATVTASVDGRAYPTVASVSVSSAPQDGSQADFLATATPDVLVSYWERATNQTLDGSSNIQQIDDVRGTGYGPSLFGQSYAAAPKPSYDAVNKKVVTNGANNYLATTEQGAYDGSRPGTLLQIVKASPQAGGNNFVAAIQRADASHYAGLYQNSAGNLATNINGFELDSGVAISTFGAAPRSVSLTLGGPLSGFGTLLNPLNALEVAGPLRAVMNAQSNAVLPTGNYQITFGGLSTGAFLLGTACDWYAGAYVMGIPSAAIMAAWKRRAVALGGSVIVTPAIGVNLLGDSRTFGQGSTGGQTYPVQLQAMLGSNYRVDNRGVPSRGMSEIFYAGDSLYLPDRSGIRSEDWFSLWLGVNGAENGYKQLAEATIILAKAKTAGYKCCAVLEIAPTPAATMAILNNGYLALLASGAIDAVAHTDLDPDLQNTASAAFADGLHLTNYGYGLVAVREYNGIVGAGG